MTLPRALAAAVTGGLLATAVSLVASRQLGSDSLWVALFIGLVVGSVFGFGVAAIIATSVHGEGQHRRRSEQ